jgi:hypothetical protein
LRNIREKTCSESIIEAVLKEKKHDIERESDHAPHFRHNEGERE